MSVSRRRVVYPFAPVEGKVVLMNGGTTMLAAKTFLISTALLGSWLGEAKSLTGNGTGIIF